MENEKLKLGTESAFPTSSEEMYDRQEKYPDMKMNGISKRFYVACAAMQGILSNQSVNYISKSDLMAECYAYADEFLKQE
jgi:hypothetical protein